LTDYYFYVKKEKQLILKIIIEKRTAPMFDQKNFNKYGIFIVLSYKGKVIILPGTKNDLHVGLFIDFMFDRGIAEEDLKCLGGGSLEINPTMKNFSVWGESSFYGGEPERKSTIEYIGRQLPGFSFKAKDDL
jgi:hypothetical protein